MNMQHPAHSLSKNAPHADCSPGTAVPVGSRHAAPYPGTQDDGLDPTPTRTKRQPVRHWVGPTWNVMTGEMIHPGQPRPRALASEGGDRQAEAGKPVVDHPAPAPATCPSDASAAETPPREKKPRKRRYSTPKAETAPTPLEDRRWLTIKQTAQRYPYSEGAVRHLVFQAEQYAKHPKNGLKSNGFLNCIVRPEGARRVLIDAEKFELWLQGQ
ncbi:hypothetical protein LMG24076_02804 [Trinickia soli]|uniref:Uncharacterized protein n=2 Tax=Trinickia soli TaxID=380675 RepID=A0A2N7W7D0_9BURK|nr:hypothetical protein C0Z19_10100 [Trinickia soli]CAB3688489.1 hypothetical protein LMG24076_02804 [Trinickia soli]